MNTWTPTGVELVIFKNHIQLRVVSPDLPLGYTVIEGSKFNKGKSLPLLRKWGEKHAKRLKVAFTDKTV
jgi:hypothetical protein